MPDFSTSRPGLKDTIAWMFIGAFLATLVWTVVGAWIYVDARGDFFGKLPLQMLLGMAVSLPSSLSMIWLTYRSTFVRIAPIQGFAKRRPTLWRVLTLLCALSASALILVAIAICSEL